MRKLWAAALCCCAFGWAVLAQAPLGDKQERYYLEFRVGGQSWDEDDAWLRGILAEGYGAQFQAGDRLVWDMPELGVSILEGLTLSKYAAIEGALTYHGEGDVAVLNSAGETVYRADIRGFGLNLAGVARLPLSRAFSVYGKAGLNYALLELKLRVPDPGNADNEERVDEIRPLFGAGVQAEFDNVVVDLSWDRTDVDDLSLSTVWLGVGLRY